MGAGASVSAAIGLNLLEHTVEGFFEEILIIIVSGFDGTTNGGEFFLTSPFCIGFGNGAVRRSGLTACGVHTGVFPGAGDRRRWQIQSEHPTMQTAAVPPFPPRGC